MGLDLERIVRVALRLLNEVGLDGLTLRRIAGEVGVQAPALYWHVPNKQALLDEMATTMLRDLLANAPTDPGDARPWQQWMVETAQSLRQMLLSYRDGARVFSGTYLTDDALLTPLETPMRRLVDAGIPIADAARAWSAVYCYTIGSTIEEQAVHPLPGEFDPRYDPRRRAGRIDTERHPLTAAAGGAGFADFDARFAYGLHLIVTGLEHAVPRARPAS